MHFIIDRILDLFVGHYKPNGLLEHRLYAVIMQNVSAKLFLEIFIGLGPFFFEQQLDGKSANYAMFKIIRYLRLFEIDS